MKITDRLSAAKLQSPGAYRKELIEVLECAEIIPLNRAAKLNAESAPLEQLEANLPQVLDAEARGCLDEDGFLCDEGTI